MTETAPELWCCCLHSQTARSHHTAHPTGEGASAQNMVLPWPINFVRKQMAWTKTYVHSDLYQRFTSFRFPDPHNNLGELLRYWRGCVVEGRPLPSSPKVPGFESWV